MDEAKIKTLEDVMKVARLIEQCQTLCLITPADREAYFVKLNDKTHSAISALLG